MWHSLPSYWQSAINSASLKPRSTFVLSGSAAKVSVSCSFLMKSSRRASRSGNALPFIVAGASNLGVSRSTGVGIAGGSLAHSEASVRLSLSQNVQVGEEGKQQRQQQWTSGGGELVTVDWATVVSSGDVCSEVDDWLRSSLVVSTSAVVDSDVKIVDVGAIVVVVSGSAMQFSVSRTNTTVGQCIGLALSLPRVRFNTRCVKNL